jgi:hypothetical protein
MALALTVPAVLLASLLSLAMPCPGQAPSPPAAASSGQPASPAAAADVSLPELPQDPKAVFAAAAPLYDFASPTLKPWHMKVSYQLYDEASNPTTKGVFEYWHSGPKMFRRSWSRDGQTQDDWWLDSKHYQMGTGGRAGYFERELTEALMPPIAAKAKLDDRWDIDWKEKPGSNKAPCLQVEQAAHAGADGKVRPMGDATVYCFDAHRAILLVYSQQNGPTVFYSGLLRTQVSSSRSKSRSHSIGAKDLPRRLISWTEFRLHPWPSLHRQDSNRYRAGSQQGKQSAQACSAPGWSPVIRPATKSLGFREPWCWQPRLVRMAICMM